MRSTSLPVYKVVPTNLLYFLYITSEVKQYYEALYLSYKPRKKCKISQLFKTNCTYSIFRTINRGLFAKPFKKFPKSPSIQPVLTFDKRQICRSSSGGRVFEWKLTQLRFNIIKNLLCLFLIQWFYNDM